MIKLAAVTSLMLGAGLLSGCANMTGYDESFSCPQGDYGSPCMSATEAYEASNDSYGGSFGGVSSTFETEEGTVKTTVHPDYAADPRLSPLTSQPLPGFRGAKPVRTPAQIMRIYVSPWVSKDGALTMAQYVFTEIEPRTWTIGEQSPAMGSRSFYPLQIRRKNRGNGQDKPNATERGKPRIQ